MREKELPIIQQHEVTGPYCSKCAYQATGVQRVLPDGNGSNGVCLVGDSPWNFEVACGRPFAGPSGKWLDTLLEKRGLKREDFLITNGGTQCKPPSLGMNDNPEDYPDAQLAQRQCRPYLDELIAERKPKVLVALGNVALRRLTGFENVESNNGYVIQSDYGIPVVPTFHPSAILQGNWNLTIGVVLALARAMEIASGTFKYTPVKVIEDPDPSYLEFPGRGDITQPLMCDIETPKSLAGRNEEEAEDDPSYQIIRMGFSVREWQGVSFPFDGDYIRRAKELVSRARTLIFWNKNYDLPRLTAAGFTFNRSVQIVDAMWAWHWLYSDLPKALAFAAPFFYGGSPWKHLASQRPAFYSGMDNAIQMGCYAGIKSQLEHDGRWDRFWSHCVRVDPIYVRMGSKGVKVDVEARAPFMAAMEKEALAELVKVQELVPTEYAKRFPDKVIQESYKELKLPKVSAKVTKRMYQSLVRVEKIEVPATHKDGTIARAENGQPVMRPLWRRSIPFNPRSRPDMLRLMHCLGVKPPKARGEDRESVEAKYLKRLTKFPIFRHCVNYSQRSKLISTYNWPLKTTEISVIEEVQVDVSQRPNKEGHLVGIEGERSRQVKESEVEARPRVQEEIIAATKSPLGQVDSRREASLRQKDASLQRRLGQEAQALEESRVQSNVSQEAPHPIHIRGSWIDSTPSREELSQVPSLISGREAMHPSLGLGQVQQRSQQLSSGMYFVPYEIPPAATTAGPFLLPITRTITSSNRATSTYGFHPSTLRSSSRNVNLGNIPKRFELAKLFRRLLIAEKGCKLIEVDRAAIEAVLVGHWAKSPAYIKLAKAGVHSMLVSHVLGRPVPDDLPFDDLKKELKAIKKMATVEQYEGCKRCIHGCLTGDHEVLTPNGWIQFSDYNGEPLAVWRSTGTIQFEAPMRVVKERWDGNMISASGCSMSGFMTPNHNLPVYRKHPEGTHMELHNVEASDLSKGFIPLNGCYHDGQADYTFNEVCLAVAIQADGTRVGNQVRFDLSKPHKIKRLKELLEGIPHRSYDSNRGTVRTVIYNKDIQAALEVCEGKSKIFNSRILLSLPQAEAKSLLDELPLWDGHIGKTKLYYTTNKANADIVQALAHIHGRTALLRKVENPKKPHHKQLYTLSFPNRSWATVRNINVRTVENFSGLIYCVTVSSGYFVVRHNSRVYVTGNSNYLLSPYGMFDEYSEFFPTEYDAQKMQDLYFGTPAGQAVRAWHKATIEEAYSKKYLDNSFEYRHYFYGPMYKFSKRERKWIVDHEGDAKRAVAFRPQSDAAAIQREDILALESAAVVNDYLRLPTYDSLILECPENLVDKGIEVLYNQFKKPIAELGGLEIGFEIKVGSNLAEMSEVSL